MFIIIPRTIKVYPISHTLCRRLHYETYNGSRDHCGNKSPQTLCSVFIPGNQNGGPDYYEHVFLLYGLLFYCILNTKYRPVVCIYDMCDLIV